MELIGTRYRNVVLAQIEGHDRASSVCVLGNAACNRVSRLSQRAHVVHGLSARYRLCG